MIFYLSSYIICFPICVKVAKIEFYFLLEMLWIFNISQLCVSNKYNSHKFSLYHWYKYYCHCLFLWADRSPLMAYPTPFKNTRCTLSRILYNHIVDVIRRWCCESYRFEVAKDTIFTALFPYPSPLLKYIRRVIGNSLMYMDTRNKICCCSKISNF